MISFSRIGVLYVSASYLLNKNLLRKDFNDYKFSGL